MQSLRIKNFRSISDSGDIQIKPITIFLGKNSCGKSSFIRTFPLIKQSLEKDISEPLLWYGDYVDFGDYKNILPFGSESDNFEMSFKINSSSSFFYYRRIRDMEVEYDVRIKFSEKNIVIFEILFFDQSIKCELEKDGRIKSIIINGCNNVIEVENYKWQKTSRELLPTIFMTKIDSSRQNYVKYYYYRFDHAGDIEQAVKLMEKYMEFSTRTSSFSREEAIYGILDDLLYPQSKTMLLKNLQTQARTKAYFNSKNIEDLEFCELNNLFVSLLIREIIKNINTSLHNEFDNTFYLKPLRANVNRYYRIQGINVNSVDSDGSNLPMILYNLGEEKKKFDNWCKKTFGLIFTVKEQGGHVSLMVEDSEHKSTNLADTGYGYSQVLPILVQLWLLKSKKESDSSFKINVVIEQPELHLHPAFQSKLMDVFVGIINEAKKNNIRIIFETHSETMINRLGYLVSIKFIDQDKVNIILVEKKNKKSILTQTAYNFDGSIDKWPIGFMSAED